MLIRHPTLPSEMVSTLLFQGSRIKPFVHCQTPGPIQSTFDDTGSGFPFQHCLPGKGPNKKQLDENHGFRKKKTKQKNKTKPPKNIRKEKESASRQIWASLLIWLLFSPLYLDNGGGWWCSWCIEYCRRSGFSLQSFFNYLLIHTLLLVIVLFISHCLISSVLLVSFFLFPCRIGLILANSKSCLSTVDSGWVVYTVVTCMVRRNLILFLGLVLVVLVV